MVESCTSTTQNNSRLSKAQDTGRFGTIFQQVTVVEGVKIGGHVEIGAGAKIIRPVQIEDHAKIGANAVVLVDVPAGATVVGVPARIILSQ